MTMIYMLMRYLKRLTMALQLKVKKIICKCRTQLTLSALLLDQPCFSSVKVSLDPQSGTVRNIPKFKDWANWSRDTFQPMRRRVCVYQQTNQNIAAVIKTADGVGQNQSSFRGSQAYF